MSERIEQDDGVRDCCQHGVPLICECPKCYGEFRVRTAPQEPIDEYLNQTNLSLAEFKENE